MEGVRSLFPPIRQNVQCPMSNVQCQVAERQTVERQCQVRPRWCSRMSSCQKLCDEVSFVETRTNVSRETFRRFAASSGSPAGRAAPGLPMSRTSGIWFAHVPDKWHLAGSYPRTSGIWPAPSRDGRRHGAGGWRRALNSQGEGAAAPGDALGRRSDGRKKGANAPKTRQSRVALPLFVLPALRGAVAFRSVSWISVGMFAVFPVPFAVELWSKGGEPCLSLAGCYTSVRNKLTSQSKKVSNDTRRHGQEVPIGGRRA